MPKSTTGGHPDLKMVNPDAAAVDIGSTMHMAAVNPSSCDMSVRAFGTFTQDLYALADWFRSCGVTSVAMESTGVYWIPAFEILEARGFEVILVNARYAKNVPGRKTDVSDAGWLRQLHSYGLLRGSFRPDAEIATLRAYMRQRERLTEYAAAHIQHMQKALMEMNLQLHHVVSDITGATGMKIIRAIVAGERDPEVLADYRDVRCKSSPETIRAAFVGNDRAEHVFALAQSLDLYDFYKAKIEECDQRLEAAVAPGLIQHSDRGIQYAADDYRQALAAAKITPSMSRKGNCLDNAPMESFFHTLKVERVHHRVYATRTEARRDLFAYIEGFYNSRRLHSGIGYRSPVDMGRMAA